jgi:hypothetical protein
MPQLPENARLWLERAEIDYIGPFVKAWAAFNAWYRHASGSRKDSDGLRYVKNQVNPVRSRIKPLLRPRVLDENGRLIVDAEDALQFKVLLRNLHAALDAYHLEILRDDNVERISFRTVCLSGGVNLPKNRSHRQHDYSCTKAHGVWVVTVIHRRSGDVTARIEQPTYSVDDLQAKQEFIDLTVEQRAQCLGLYNECNPRPMTDLIGGNNTPILAGDIAFQCTDEQLFAGLIEVIYGMRNALLHGELHPNEQAFQAYEHAYRIILQFLDCLRN